MPLKSCNVQFKGSDMGEFRHHTNGHLSGGDYLTHIW